MFLQLKVKQKSKSHSYPRLMLTRMAKKRRSAKKKSAKRSAKKKSAKKKAARLFKRRGIRLKRRWAADSAATVTYTCGAITQNDGHPCERPVDGAGQRCWQHDG